MKMQAEEHEQRYPRRIGSIVNQLMARRGYAQVQSTIEMEQTIKATVGEELAKACQPGNVRRGTLEIGVGDSVAVQELSFHKRALVKAFQKEFPASGIKDIRFRVG